MTARWRVSSLREARMARNETRAQPPHHVTPSLCGVATFLQLQPRAQPQTPAPAADLEASSPGQSLISLQQSTLVLSKQTEEIYACLRLWRAPHSGFNESSSFRDHSRSDGEDVCFVQRKDCHRCLPLFLRPMWRCWGWRARLCLGPRLSAPPEETVPFFLCQHPQAQSVGPFPPPPLWESHYNAALKGSTCYRQDSKRQTVLCNKTLGLLVGKHFPPKYPCLSSRKLYLIWSSHF